MSETEKVDPTKEPVAPSKDITPLKFDLSKVTSKPKRAYRKGSKYDPILDAFLKSPNKLVTLDVKGKDANYLRTQMNKRIEARKLEKKVKVSVTNAVCYLEKT